MSPDAIVAPLVPAAIAPVVVFTVSAIEFVATNVVSLNTTIELAVLLAVPTVLLTGLYALVIVTVVPFAR